MTGGKSRLEEYQDYRAKGLTKHHLLALIAQRPRYGFELIQRLDEVGLLVAGEGSIYPLLSRMQNDELIAAFVVTSEGTGRKRKYYRIMPNGEEALEQWNREWEEFKANMDSVIGRER